jgi:hypothetical protein
MKCGLRVLRPVESRSVVDRKVENYYEKIIFFGNFRYCFDVTSKYCLV